MGTETNRRSGGRGVQTKRSGAVAKCEGRAFCTYASETKMEATQANRDGEEQIAKKGKRGQRVSRCE